MIEYVIEWVFGSPGEAVSKWHSELPDNYRPVTQLKITDKGPVEEDGVVLGRLYRVSGYYVIDPGWQRTDGTYELGPHPGSTDD